MYVGLFNLGMDDCALMRTPSERLQKSVDLFGVSDKTGSCEFDRARLFQSLTYNTRESRLETVPTVCSNTGRVIVAWVRLDNREELAASLSLDKEQLRSTTDPTLILMAYERWASGCVDHLLGDFSFCIFDSNQRSVFAARDPVGVKPLFYHVRGRVIVIAGGARVFHALDGLKLEPTEKWLAQYSIGQSMSFTDTCWEQVSKLAPGHFIEIDSRKPLRISRYFSWKNDPPQVFRRQDKYVELYRAELEKSVKCRLRTAYSLGSETSGGLDSATVTGYAARFLEPEAGDLHTFGHAYCADEPQYILETSQWHNIEHNHIATGRQSDDIGSRLSRAWTILGYPDEQSFGSSYESFYRDSQHLGIRTLLSGFGGDEMVTNSGHLLFHELVDSGEYFQLWRSMGGALPFRTARFCKSIYACRKGGGRQSRLAAEFASRWPDYLLREDIEQRYRLRECYIESANYDSKYRRINDFILGDRMAPFVATRLENCTLMAAARNIDYRWPLLDVRLMQQYLSTPSIEKFGQGYGRYLHRRAVEGMVPPKVQWKKSKYMGQTILGKNSGVGGSGADLALAELVKRLANDLHPALESIIDIPRKNKQLSVLKNLPREQRMNLSFASSSHYRALHTLNDWLQACHP